MIDGDGGRETVLIVAAAYQVLALVLATVPLRLQAEATCEAVASRAAMLVLSWNLFHGRAVPAAGRPLLAEFARALAGWSWDVALLQEVPPWWPPRLGAASRASARMALTSRNVPMLPRRVDRGAQSRPARRGGRRLQRDPGPRGADPRAPHA